MAAKEAKTRFRLIARRTTWSNGSREETVRKLERMLKNLSAQVDRDATWSGTPFAIKWVTEVAQRTEACHPTVQSILQLAFHVCILHQALEKERLLMTTTLNRRPMSASSITGDEIKNRQDETLGSVHDIMIDCGTGRVAYIVMTSGGFLGMGGKLFAVPMSALQLDTECKCLRMDASKETFDAADGFDKDNWPDMADPKLEQAAHTRYGARPYWED